MINRLPRIVANRMTGFPLCWLLPSCCGPAILRLRSFSARTRSTYARMSNNAFPMWAGLAVDNTAEAPPPAHPPPTWLWQKFPKFVLEFILMSPLATAGIFRKAQITDIHSV